MRAAEPRRPRARYRVGRTETPLIPVAVGESMNWFDGMVSLPALAVLYGLTFGGRLGAIAGFVGGVVAGSLGLYLDRKSVV